MGNINFQVGLNNTSRRHIAHDSTIPPPRPPPLTLAPAPGVGPLAGHHGLLALPLEQRVAVQQQRLPVLAPGGRHAGRDTAVQVVQPDGGRSSAGSDGIKGGQGRGVPRLISGNYD